MGIHIRGFGSDNHAGVHEEVMQALSRANVGHVHSYGADPHTEEAVAKFREILGAEVEVFFVFNGTGANVTALGSISQFYDAVICAEGAHLNVDECGAPERVAGVKLLSVPAPDGKLTPESITAYLSGRGDEHQVRPGVVSITQSTELGTVYTLDEIRALADCAHERGLRVHVDGARIANAAVSLGVELRQATGDCGVDVLSFGGTKNGLMWGEAVVFFNAELATHYRYARKQGMQLASKMRYVAAQFAALLTDDLWRRNARHANAMAQHLAGRVRQIPGVEVIYPVEANAIFARLPLPVIPVLQREFFFYPWDAAKGEVRWMTSFDTEAYDVEAFAALIETTMAKGT